MSLLWQLQTEMLSFFFEPNRLLDVVSSFLQGEGFLAGCGFWGKEETSAEFQLAKLQENLYIIAGGIRNFRFWRLLYECMHEIWWFFFLTARERKILSICQFPKNLPPGTRSIGVLRTLNNPGFLWRHQNRNPSSYGTTHAHALLSSHVLIVTSCKIVEK